MQTIIKIESKIVNGVTVSRKRIFHPKDKGYCLEMLRKKAFDYAQSQKPLTITSKGDVC